MRIFVSGPWGDFASLSSFSSVTNNNGKKLAGIAAKKYTVKRNILKADWKGQELVHQGHEVYIPHTMCRTWSGNFTVEEMVRLDRSFLEHWAEAIYRIPGKSAGADAEVLYATRLGLILLTQADLK